MEERLQNVETDVRALRADVAEIKEAMAKQRGFIAGMASAFTLLWGVIAALATYAWRQMTG